MLPTAAKPRTLTVSNANRGKGLEELLAWQHAIYEARGLYVQQNPTPYKPLRAGHRPPELVVVPLGEAPPDYLLVADGVAYLLDAKSTREERWSLDNLKGHQAASFSRWERQGSTFRAGVVLQLAAGPLWWLPWAALAPAWETWRDGRARRGEASLGEDWLAANARRVVGVDWLAVARS